MKSERNSHMHADSVRRLCFSLSFLDSQIHAHFLSFLRLLRPIWNMGFVFRILQWTFWFNLLAIFAGLAALALLGGVSLSSARSLLGLPLAAVLSWLSFSLFSAGFSAPRRHRAARRRPALQPQKAGGDTPLRRVA